jgi:hypothetical protein
VALERALLGPSSEAATEDCKDFVRLIRQIAWDATVFTRCAALLLKLAALEEANNNSTEGARNVFVSLFSLYLSGTHATIEQRLSVLKPLLYSLDEKERELGLKSLGAMLEATHIGSAYSFEFGSRVRDYGYWRKTIGDVRNWFARALQFALEIASSEAACAKAIRHGRWKFACATARFNQPKSHRGTPSIVRKRRDAFEQSRAGKKDRDLHEKRIS